MAVKGIVKDGRRYYVGIRKDKDGYYARTHRARSKSYSSKEAIPKKVLAFIESTG